MDETLDIPAEQTSEQLVFVSPELLQAAQRKQQRRQEQLNALREAAESGDAAALLELGLYYLSGDEGQPRDAKRAYACFSQLPPDNPAGRYYLSCCYDRGHGVEPDGERALALLREAAEADYPPALCTLGLSYESGSLGLERDAEQAARLYQAAAEQSFPPGLCSLGVLYYHGIGVEQDKEKAAALYEQAMQQDNADAAFRLGSLCAEGRGVPADPARAAALYARAAEAGHVPAQHHYAYCLQHGQGVGVDLAAARQWYERAAAQGSAYACNSLGAMYQQGQGCPKDIQQAIAWYQRGVERGSPHAAYNLGLLYENGQKLKRDPQAAADWYRKARELGHPEADKALHRVTRQNAVTHWLLLTFTWMMGLSFYFLGTNLFAQPPAYWPSKAPAVLLSGIMTVVLLVLRRSYPLPRRKKSKRARTIWRILYGLSGALAAFFFAAGLSSVLRFGGAEPVEYWLLAWLGVAAGLALYWALRKEP